MKYDIDPELRPLVDLIPEVDLEDLAAARANMDVALSALNSEVDTTGVDITDVDVPSDDRQVRVRLYSPETDSPGVRPALLDIHGGGFVLGSIAMDHAFAVAAARSLGALVASVEYRLAPEHPFPAGVEDCYVALTWLHDHAGDLRIDADRIGVGGQSAGGGLSAAVALMARDRGGPPLCFQSLGIPELDHRLDTASMRAFVDTPIWHQPNAVLSWRHYLGPEPGEVSPYASPAIADDLGGLPPAYITAMEFDPLRDEAIHYALRLMAAGVTVELHTFPGTFHGSSIASTAAVSRRAHAELLDALRRGLRVDR